MYVLEYCIRDAPIQSRKTTVLLLAVSVTYVRSSLLRRLLVMSISVTTITGRVHREVAVAELLIVSALWACARFRSFSEGALSANSEIGCEFILFIFKF